MTRRIGKQQVVYLVVSIHIAVFIVACGVGLGPVASCDILTQAAQLNTALVNAEDRQEAISAVAGLYNTNVGTDASIGSYITDYVTWETPYAKYTANYHEADYVRTGLFFKDNYYSVEEVFGCMGSPDFYEASVVPGIHGSQLLASFWYPEEGVVAYLVEPINTEDLLTIHPSFAVDTLHFASPGRIERFVSLAAPYADEDQTHADWLARLEPWPGNLRDISLIDLR